MYIENLGKKPGYGSLEEMRVLGWGWWEGFFFTFCLFDMFTISMNLFANNKRMIFRTEGLEFPWCKGAAKVSLQQGLFFQLIHLLKMVTTKKYAATASAMKLWFRTPPLVFQFFLLHEQERKNKGDKGRRIQFTGKSRKWCHGWAWTRLRDGKH